MLICHLMDKQRSVGELADLVGLSQSNASQHLTQLRLHGLVLTERVAQTVYYSIASEPARQVLQVLHDQFCSHPNQGKSPC